jgi:signal transduction histidine kinase
MTSFVGPLSNGKKILIVEDSRTQAMLLRHVLEEHGYEVREARSGKEALGAMETETPALVISDIVMPEMDGYALTRAMKDHGSFVNIPVILMTTLSNPMEVIKGLDSRADFYLNKPWDEDFLVSKVESILSGPYSAKNGKSREECHVNINGQSHVVKVSAEQSLNLLVSTYENAVHINQKLLSAQHELAALNHDLERKVRERTDHLRAEIQQRQETEKSLAQRSEELEAANKELNEFAYIVSHDLKAPLRGVSQLAGWLASDYADSLDEDGKDLLSTLTGRLDRMHNLIEGILQYSKIGRVKDEEEEIDLDLIVRETVDLLAPPPSFLIKVGSKLPTVRFDPTRVRQVFQNLISNAIKYNDKPEGLIEIDCEDLGTQYRFAVSDNGPGIDEKYHEKIFGIFQTLNARDEFESTGIGLSVVKKVVEMKKGKIWVESKAGEGTRFVFTIPKN